MDTNTNFRISIPKPCHEDWNKFTPDQKGAFCKVCSKSVHDFTKKSADEIKTILIEEMSVGAKVCGRFNEDQLDTPILKEEMQEQINTYLLNFKKIKRFAMALFFVFGGYLFNTTRSLAQKNMIMGKMKYVEPVRGEVAIRKDPVHVKDSSATKTDTILSIPKVTKCNSMTKGDVMIEPIEKLAVLGGVSAMPVEQPTVKGNAIIEPTKGQVAIVEDTIVDIEVPVVGDTLITAIETKVEPPMIMGMMVAMPILIDPIPNDSIQQLIDGEFAVEESTYVETEKPIEEKIIPAETNSLKIECYPNPSKGFLNIKYSVKENVPNSIVLYDMNGNLAKTLLSPQTMYAADYQTQFDVSDLKSGIYFCELNSGGKKTTAKIVISK